MAGMEKWDHTPRAVFPSPRLLQAQHPILSTHSISTASPLPYGIAVFLANDSDTNRNATQRPLPMYWVSQVAAIRRKIPSGWYLYPSESNSIEKNFSLRLTNVQPAENHRIHRRKLTGSLSCVAEISIDGINVGGRPKLSAKKLSPGKELSVQGFTIQKKFGSDREGMNFVKSFRWTRTGAKEEDEEVAEEREEDYADSNSKEHVGMIQVRLFSGKRRYRELTKFKKFTQPLKKAPALSEIEVNKDGRRFAVERIDSPVVKKPTTRVGWKFVPEQEEGCITVFVREKRWLKIKSIINEDGSPFKDPVPSPRKSSSRRRRKSRRSARKQTRRAPIKDFIDLTLD